MLGVFKIRRDTQRRTYEDRDKDWSEALTSQEMPRTAGKQQKPGRGRKNLPWRLQREHGSANILILNFLPPEQWGIHLLF